ncbi:uncharacterized protein LOC143290275 [Babylonia areolata]|uniref:uncharacterized protein LOC143290275 n=1 Tax=Babylonia areolata TaxID=304850 RepID=UPI003FD3E5B6
MQTQTATGSQQHADPRPQNRTDLTPDVTHTLVTPDRTLTSDRTLTPDQTLPSDLTHTLLTPDLTVTPGLVHTLLTPDLRNPEEVLQGSVQEMVSGSLFRSLNACWVRFVTDITESIVRLLADPGPSPASRNRQPIPALHWGTGSRAAETLKTHRKKENSSGSLTAAKTRRKGADAQSDGNLPRRRPVPDEREAPEEDDQNCLHRDPNNTKDPSITLERKEFHEQPPNLDSEPGISSEEEKGLSDMDPEELQSFLKDFRAVFPWVSVDDMEKDGAGVPYISEGALDRPSGPGQVPLPCLLKWRLRALRRILRVCRSGSELTLLGRESGGDGMERLWEGLDKLMAPLGPEEMRRCLLQIEAECEASLAHLS